MPDVLFYDDIVSSDEHMSEATRARVLEWFRVASQPKLSQTMKPEEVVLPEWFKGLAAVVRQRADGEMFSRDYEARYRKLVSENHPNAFLALVTEAGQGGRHHLVSFLDLMGIKAFCPKFDNDNAVPWISDRMASLRWHLERWAKLGESDERIASMRVCIEALETRAGVKNLNDALKGANTELDILRKEVNKLRDGVVASETIAKQAEAGRVAMQIERDALHEGAAVAVKRIQEAEAEITKLRDENTKLRDEVIAKVTDEVIAKVTNRPAAPTKPRPPRKRSRSKRDEPIATD